MLRFYSRGPFLCGHVGVMLLMLVCAMDRCGGFRYPGLEESSVLLWLL